MPDTLATIQVLRTISEGLVACLLERGDSSKAMLRAVTRELLAAAVLRNVMFYFTPYTLNKVGLFAWLGMVAPTGFFCKPHADCRAQHPAHRPSNGCLLVSHRWLVRG